MHNSKAKELTQKSRGVINYNFFFAHGKGGGTKYVLVYEECPRSGRNNEEESKNQTTWQRGRLLATLLA